MADDSKTYLDNSSEAPPTHPVVARMYDWYLGGTHSYAIDRKAALDVQKALPDIKPLVVENRAFLHRALRWLAKNGVKQFIDMGSGLPTVGSTHETVLRVESGARVLYVDIEETVVVEGRDIIRKAGFEGQVGFIQVSALNPAKIWDNPETRRIIDFSQPVAILMIALIHFFRPPQYISTLEFWKSNLVKGSAFVMTHCTTDGRDPEGLRRTEEVYEKTPTPVFPRPRAEIVPIMEGWELVEPGLSRPEVWRMEEMLEEEEEPPITNMWWVAVGLLK